MYGIKSSDGTWSISLCNCSRNTVHFHYGNCVLHISLGDLRALGSARQKVADRVEQTESEIEKRSTISHDAGYQRYRKGRCRHDTLIVCSLISVALTIERILFWSKLKSREVLHGILTHVEKGEFDQALKLGKGSQ